MYRHKRTLAPATGDGLGITIHGVSYVEIRLIKFEKNPNNGNYHVKLSVELFDNFGLGEEDVSVANPFKQYYKLFTTGFTAWYLLQHKFDYKPLRTHVSVPIEAYLNLNLRYLKR